MKSSINLALRKIKNAFPIMVIKLLPGLFQGYHRKQGGGSSGDLLLLDQEQLNEADHV